MDSFQNKLSSRLLFCFLNYDGLPAKLLASSHFRDPTIAQYCIHSRWKHCKQAKHERKIKTTIKSVCSCCQSLQFKQCPNLQSNFRSVCFATNAVCLCVRVEIPNFTCHVQHSCANHVGIFGFLDSIPEEDDKTS